MQYIFYQESLGGCEWSLVDCCMSFGSSVVDYLVAVLGYVVVFVVSSLERVFNCCPI